MVKVRFFSFPLSRSLGWMGKIGPFLKLRLSLWWTNPEDIWMCHLGSVLPRKGESFKLFRRAGVGANILLWRWERMGRRVSSRYKLSSCNQEICRLWSWACWLYPLLGSWGCSCLMVFTSPWCYLLKMSRRDLREMATQSSALVPFKIPWMEKLTGHSPWRCKESDTIWAITLFQAILRFEGMKLKQLAL